MFKIVAEGKDCDGNAIREGDTVELIEDWVSRLTQTVEGKQGEKGIIQQFLVHQLYGLNGTWFAQVQLEDRSIMDIVVPNCRKVRLVWKGNNWSS